VQCAALGPAITIAAGAKPPGEFVRKIIIRGSGPPVLTPRTVTVQDAGVVRRTGKASARPGYGISGNSPDVKTTTRLSS
jgi:hypothetical protein